MDDFRHLTWDEVRAEAAEDVDFTVEHDDQSGPAWDVWALTYPLRGADARQYLTHIQTHAEVYWYRDRRDDRVYGMPDIDLVRRENDRVISANRRGDVRRAAVKRVHYAVGMFLFLSLVLLGLAPDVIPWIWVAIPAVIVAYRHAMNHMVSPRYAKLAEVRFDVFVSDAEIRERRQRLLANVLTLGFVVVVLWLLHRR